MWLVAVEGWGGCDTVADPPHRQLGVEMLHTPATPFRSALLHTENWGMSMNPMLDITDNAMADLRSW